MHVTHILASRPSEATAEERVSAPLGLTSELIPYILRQKLKPTNSSFVYSDYCSQLLKFHSLRQPLRVGQNFGSLHCAWWSEWRSRSFCAPSMPLDSTRVRLLLLRHTAWRAPNRGPMASVGSSRLVGPGQVQPCYTCHDALNININIWIFRTSKMSYMNASNMQMKLRGSEHSDVIEKWSAPTIKFCKYSDRLLWCVEQLCPPCQTMLSREG